jgi:hypothetical protein
VAGIPFFFKQWGGVRKASAGRKLEGQTHNAMPMRARVPIPAARERRALVAHLTSLHALRDDR